MSQYVTDMYAKIESERLQYIRHHQKELRVDSYENLRDAIYVDGDNPGDVGTATVLPSSFTGSPRYMFERSQDAMRYCQLYGRPDLFLTMTANKAWPEIQEQLYPGQTAHERHDIIARVFRLKVELLKDLLFKVGIFGPRIAHVATIEWQKRQVLTIYIIELTSIKW